MAQGIEYLLSEEKRNLDVVGGIAIGLALLPVGAAVGAATALDTRSLNPFFLQRRSGGFREAITTFKFQTLSRNLGSFAADQTFGTFDPRASKFAQAIRQSGLDEMPQILNVIRGDMSLVGARPLTEQDIDRYASVDPKMFDQWHPIYTSAKPGLTGESQIYRHHFRTTSDEMISASMQMDIDYAQNASLATDLKWLARTPLWLAKSNIGVVENLPLAQP